MSDRASNTDVILDSSQLSPEASQIVAEESQILDTVLARLQRDADAGPTKIENLDTQLLELRDQISEAKEDDVASLIEQMHQVAALSRKRGKGRSLPVDPKNPYFGHLRLVDAKRGRTRDVLVGKRTLLDDGEGLTIVDWRNAPISRLYYRYEEGEEYEEEFDERSLEGKVMLRRSLGLAQGRLRRIVSPQGSFVSNRAGRWQDLGRDGMQAALSGGAGAAIRVPRGQLGVQEGEDLGSDKHLQEITALIDKEQFAMITQPESGIVLIQGGAGSGKTTVALHRVAYLTFQDARRFAPSKMLIVVFNEALVEYIKHVLPALGVQGTTVTTYRRWSASILRRLKIELPTERTEATPDPVSRFKKHPALIRMLDRRVAAQREELRAELEEKLATRPGGESVLRRFDQAKNFALLETVQRTLAWVRAGGEEIAGRTRSTAESVLSAALEELGDIVNDWCELMGDDVTMGAALQDPELSFSANEQRTVLKWCRGRAGAVADWVDRNRAAKDPQFEGYIDQDDRLEDPPEAPALDGEDDAILLRLAQLKRGGLFAGKRRIEYEHIVIDEAQDLCPLEVRVLLETASAGKSITIAGDRAQKMIFDNGFSDWPQLLADAGLPHVAIQPLKITYRSTRQIMDLAHHVLGPLRDETDGVVAREGAPVAYYSHSHEGESVAFLAEALRSLMRREPSASVALLTRFPEQASLYYEGLRLAEVPNLRLVSQQDFRFTPGIDVTDVRQVKGLEFDYVVLLDPTEQNYPVTVAARHLMHIAATRSAFQLWIVNAGRPSKLLPPALVEAGELLSE